MRSVYGGSKIGVLARAPLLLLIYALMAALPAPGPLAAAIPLG